MTERLSLYSGLILIVVLSVLDVMTTHSAMRAGAIEGNPLAQWLMDNGALLSVKLAACIVLALVASRVRVRDGTFAASVVWFIVGVYAVTVVSNAVNG